MTNIRNEKMLAYSSKFHSCDCLKFSLNLFWGVVTRKSESVQLFRGLPMYSICVVSRHI